jgi:response regulator RpfG family c-di-GMP phosphodiesterase
MGTPVTVKAKVLLVDDEENILRSLRRLLADEEYEVLTATGGEEGLRIMTKEPDIGLILSDQRMPGMSGVDFLEKAGAIAPDTLRILLTGYADINATIDAINKGGASRYIAKPWNDNELILIIRDAIQKYRLIKENQLLKELTEKQNQELKKWSAKLGLAVQQQTVDLEKQNVELTRLHERLSRNMKAMIAALSSLIELRDVTVLNHSNNVAYESVALARKLDLDAGAVESIEIAAHLHDIGKIGMPDVVLLKNKDEMTEAELEEYRMHPVRGQAAIHFVEEFNEVGLFIRHHHEWYDGRGFPEGLSGSAIPLGSRILAVANSFDRLSGRVGGPDGPDVALGKMAPLVGKQFDPQLFHVFKKTVREIASTMSASENDAAEVELGIKDLLPGLAVSRDVRSGTGLLLLRRGTTLGAESIGLMKKCLLLDPSKTGIFVWHKRTEVRGSKAADQGSG